MRMPRARAAVLVLGSVLALTSCSSNSTVITVQWVDGSGVLDLETRQVPTFQRVLFGAIGQVDVYQGQPQFLSVEAEDNLLPYLETYVAGDSLLIESASGYELNPTLPIRFDMTLLDLVEVTHAGVGTVDVHDPITPDLLLWLYGVGDLNVTNLTGQNLDVLIDGVGEIRATGTVDTQTVYLTGVGDYDGTDLASVDAVVTNTSPGSVTVRVSGTLDVTIRGTGSVYYIGNPVIVNEDVSGGGTLQQIP